MQDPALPELPAMNHAILRTRLLAASLLLGLTACGAPDPSPPAATGRPVQETSKASGPESPQDLAQPPVAHDFDALIGAANAALAADRMFAPPGDNALELLVRVIEARPEDARARQGLVDILPFVLIGLEQRLVAGDVAETERLLELFRRADPAHPALVRLAEQLDAERQRQKAAESARVDAEAQRAALAAVESAASAQTEVAERASTPAPAVPAPVVEQVTPSIAVAAPPQPARPVAESPPPAMPIPAVEPASLPPARVQIPARYPPQAQRRRIEGLVEVEFTVRADGSVADARVLRSEPEGVFDREALGAIQRWRFEATGREIVGRRVFDFRLGG